MNDSSQQNISPPSALSSEPAPDPKENKDVNTMEDNIQHHLSAKESMETSNSDDYDKQLNKETTENENSLNSEKKDNKQVKIENYNEEEEEKEQQKQKQEKQEEELEGKSETNPTIEKENNDSNFKNEIEKQEQKKQKHHHHHHQNLEKSREPYNNNNNNQTMPSPKAEVINFFHEVNQSFSQIKQNTTKPNILLLGGSGAGKSSLVNTVFGRRLAEIGEGKPITKSYQRFDSKETPVVIYDSRGIEHGTAEDQFVNDTKRFFKSIRARESPEHHIHVVWYLIDLTQARFQSFEARFIKEHLRGIPVLFILNKSDTVDRETITDMKTAINKFRIPNSHGIFTTVTSRKNFEASKHCGQCHSSSVRKRLKDGSCTVLCKECGGKTILSQTEGIEELSQETMAAMPEFIHRSFQEMHQQRIKEIIEDQAVPLILSATEKVSLLYPDPFRQELKYMTERALSLFEINNRDLTYTATFEVMSAFDHILRRSPPSYRYFKFYADPLNHHILAKSIVVTLGIRLLLYVCQMKLGALLTVITTHSSEEMAYIDTAKAYLSGISKQCSIEEIEAAAGSFIGGQSMQNYILFTLMNLI